MNWGWIVPTATQGLTTLAGHITKPRMKSFGSTRFGASLQKRANEGAYPSETRRKILGLTSRTLGNEAGMQRATIQGRLARAGTGNSIAGIRAIGEPGRVKLSRLADYSTQLDIENEIEKRLAEDEYARAEMAYEDARQERQSGDRRALLGGIAQTGMTGYGGYLRERDQDMRDNYYQARASKYNKEAAAAEPPDWTTATEDQVMEWATRNMKPDAAKAYIWQYLQATEGQ